MQHLWYQRMNEALNGDNARLAALAVLSPQLTVSDNVRALIELERRGHTRLGFPSNIEKAAAILWYARRGGTDFTPWVHGPKVSEFYRSLLLVDGAVCVDRHMLHWGGCGHQWTKRNVAHVKTQVLEYARNRGLRSFEAQAEIWCRVAAVGSRRDPCEIVADLEARLA